jgi:hypothetical protein
VLPEIVPICLFPAHFPFDRIHSAWLLARMSSGVWVPIIHPCWSELWTRFSARTTPDATAQPTIMPPPVPDHAGLADTSDNLHGWNSRQGQGHAVGSSSKAGQCAGRTTRKWR